MGDEHSTCPDAVRWTLQGLQARKSIHLGEQPEVLRAVESIYCGM